MARPQRFLFDRSFDDLELSSVPGAAADARPARAELDAARADGLAQGRAAALAEIAERIETRAADTLMALDRGVGALLTQRAADAQQMEGQALALVRAVLQKAAPALCRKDPAGEIEALVARCLGETIDEPRVVLRVSDALFDTMQTRLDAMTQAHGYGGKLVLIADAALAIGDARVEWADGGAERDTGRLLAEIDAILSRNQDASPLPQKDKADE
jgi:flagellar assembly protein FliH